MLLDIEHTAARSQAAPVVVRISVTRSLARPITLTLSLALSPLPLPYSALAVMLARLVPLVHAAPARLPTPPGFDIDADSGQGSGGGTRPDSRHDHRGARTTSPATVTADTANIPQSNDRTLQAAITLTDMLAAGAEGFLTAYDGAEVPCELPDCPYVASIVVGEFMALCCYDCALYHAHSCSRVRFPSCFSAPGGTLPASAGESGEREDDDTDAIAAAVVASLTFLTPQAF